MNKFFIVFTLTVGLARAANAEFSAAEATEVCRFASDVAFTSSRLFHDDDVELQKLLKLANETFKSQTNNNTNQYMQSTVINAYNHKNLSPEAMRDKTLAACLKSSRLSN